MWTHFHHEADIGVRGTGHSPEEAFEQAAVALTAVITDLLPEPFARQRRRLVGTGLYLEVADEAHRSPVVQGFVDCLQGVEDGLQFTLDIGAGGMGLHDKIVVPQHLHDAGNFRTHRNTGTDRDDLKFCGGFHIGNRSYLDFS